MMNEDDVNERIFSIYKKGVARLRPNFTDLKPETDFRKDLNLRSSDRKAFARPINKFLKGQGKKRLSRPAIVGCKNIQEVQKKVWKKFSA